MLTLNDIKNKDILLFDCDGVILDSNHLKTEAYYQIIKNYDHQAVTDFLTFHRSHGGISRFIKFELFFRDYVKKVNYQEMAAEASKKYAELTVDQLKQAPVNDGFIEFITQMRKRKFVISGGARSDLLEVFKHKQMMHLFDGIYGSPPDKYKLFNNMNIDFSKAVYFGDSKVDYEVAHFYQVDFVFMSKLTEFTHWKEYFLEKDVLILNDFRDIISSDYKARQK